MDQDVLVNRLVNAGAQLLQALDDAGLPIEDAFWWRDRETKRWQLYIATPLAETEGPLYVYRVVDKHLPESDGLSLSDIAVASPRDRLVTDLRGAVHKSRVDITGQRLTGDVVDNVFIEDGYIYRVA